LGHFGTKGTIADVWACVADAVSCVGDRLANIVRERQQHETPPKIWLYATASNRTIWRFSEGIVRIFCSDFDVPRYLDEPNVEFLHGNPNFFLGFVSAVESSSRLRSEYTNSTLRTITGEGLSSMTEVKFEVPVVSNLLSLTVVKISEMVDWSNHKESIRDHIGQ
jgi:hypothetical protein